MFSSSRLRLQGSFLNKFQAGDQYFNLQSSTASGLRKPKATQRRALKRWAVHGNHTSILTPKMFSANKHSVSVQESENFDGVSDDKARQIMKKLPKMQRESFVVSDKLPPSSHQDHQNDESSKPLTYGQKVRQILSNPQDDPENYPRDSWERERAQIRRRAKLSMIKKENFYDNFKDRAVRDEVKYGVESPSEEFKSMSKASRKEERWFRLAKKLGLNGLDSTSNNKNKEQIMNNNTRNHHQTSSSSPRHMSVLSSSNEGNHDNNTSMMRFTDLDQKIRNEQLSSSSAPDYDEGEDLHREVFGNNNNIDDESHLTPEEISIRFYEQNVLANQQPHQYNQNQQDFYHDDQDIDISVNNNNAQQQHHHQNVKFENEDFDEGESAFYNQPDDDDEATTTATTNQEQQTEGGEEDLRTEPYEYYNDGTLKPIHERLWEKHQQMSKEKVEQVTVATNIHSEREIKRGEKQGYLFDKKRTPSEFSIRSNQERFDELLERAIVLFSHPTADSASTTNIATFLHRADPNFHPQQYGAPELLFLLRNSSFLLSWKGKWAFVRLFDKERDDVTVKLERYKWREAPSFDGIRTVPREVGGNSIRWS